MISLPEWGYQTLCKVITCACNEHTLGHGIALLCMGLGKLPPPYAVCSFLVRSSLVRSTQVALSGRNVCTGKLVPRAVVK